MGRYIIRRLLIAIPTLIAISFVMFAILELSPIDPLGSYATDPRVPPEVRENIKHQMGLDQPWPLQYVHWLASLAQGNFGISFMSHSSVSDLLWQSLPNTLAVVGVAYLVGVAIGVPVGIISAIRRNTLTDGAITLSTYVGFSVPTFFTGILFIIIFSIKLHWFTFLYDSRLQVHDLETLGLQFKQSIMPIMVLGLFDAAILARYMRASMLENISLDYVRTAHSKGLHERLVVLRHVLRNSLIPVVTLIALGVPAVFGGAIVTEQIFHVPGIGNLLITSIGVGDTPVITATVVIFSVLVVGFNLLADVLYGVLDPRIRYA